MQREGGEGGSGVASQQPHRLLPPPEDLVVRARAVGGLANRPGHHRQPAHAGGLGCGPRPLIHGVWPLRYVLCDGGMGPVRFFSDMFSSMEDEMHMISL